ncbi:MAG TPA: putative porin [Acetobacteraceae bacterium]|nr:putative porin [Acetobacteraceae bacterium]
MTERFGCLARFGVLCLLLAAASGSLSRAHAQPATPSVTERLIELLVQKGVLPRAQANALLKQAEAEARGGAQQRHRQVAAGPRGKRPAATPAAEQAAAGSAEPKLPPGTVRVTYVPQIVRDQIAAQVRNEVLQKAKNEGWAEPNQVPDWVHRITMYGDMRIRGQGDFLPQGNIPDFVDFATLNAGPPYDITGSSGGPPLLDTTEDRWRVRLRARIGMRARIDDWLSADIRIATGNDASPVSTNQTLGQSGAFAKDALWLDRGFLKATPIPQVTLYAGRMPNPFWTTDLIYYDDLSFDGFAATGRQPVWDGVAAFGSLGAFPVFNTAFNFGTTANYPSRNGWLFGVQGGAEWRITTHYTARFAAGYFSYSNIQGKLSSPCTILYASDTCQTDNTRMLFPSNGNTMMTIRDLVVPATNPNGPQPQYFGLASAFDILDLHGRVDIDTFDPIRVALEAEFSDNLGFNRANVLNLGLPNGSNTVQAGNKAWMIRGIVGTPEIAQRWDWNASLTYKYLESDSVLAALNDPDFHLGGTNAKGFILAGNLGVARNAWVTVRWLSSNQVSGGPYSVDTVQADLNVRF